MSTEHHGRSPEEEHARDRLIDEIFGRAKLKWPRGQIDPDDQGEIAMAVATDPVNKVVRIQFAKPIIWIGLNKESAVNLRDLLTEKIKELNG